MTVLENLMLAQHLEVDYGDVAGILGVPDTFATETELKRRAMRVLEFMGLDELAMSTLHGLPYGTLKTIEVAAVLATDPDVLLLDEPAAGMGPEEAHAFGDRVKTMRDELGITVVMIDHHIPLVVARFRLHVLSELRHRPRGGFARGGPFASGSGRRVPRRRRRREGGQEVGTEEETGEEEEQEWRCSRLRDSAPAYGDVEVVYGIDFEVEEGETAVFLGLNGAAKTTTMLCVAGLHKPSGGTITFDGEDITGLDARKLVAKGITLVPEGRRVFPALSVERNLQIGAWTKRRDSDSSTQTQARRSTSTSRGSRSARDQLAGTLSGGEQQMLAVARGLMCDPKLLMIDEASLGLAPVIVQNLLKIIKQVNETGVTVLLVEQNIARAELSPTARSSWRRARSCSQAKGKELKQKDKLREAFLGAA